MERNRKIKVLHVVQEMHSGGVERRKLLLVKHLPNNRFEQKIICSRASDEMKNCFERVGCEVFEVGQLLHPFDLKVHSKTARIIRAFKPDIIHGSVFEGMTIAALGGLRYGIKCRIIEETSLPVNRSWKAEKLLKFFSFISHKTIAISPSVKEYLLHKVGIPKKKIQLIQNGVQDPIYLTDTQKKELKAKYEISPNDFVIGSIGRMMNDVKGFDRLIMEFANVKFRIPEAKLIIVGDGPLLNHYKEMAGKLKILKDLRFTGYLSEVNDLYEIMDAYITLPRSEGFGLSVAEAMSHGLPVIATATGGLQDIISHASSGFLVTNPEQAAAQVVHLYNSPETRIEMARKAKENWKQNYSQEIYVKQIQSFYSNCLNKIDVNIS